MTNPINYRIKWLNRAKVAMARKFLPSLLGWLSHHQLYSGRGADIVYGIITLIDLKKGEQTVQACVIARFRQLWLGAVRIMVKS